ncbi:cytochrome P450 [Mycobacterium sp. CBMA271]|uniref:cytochrome P450 n=1 Tax=unclassified Mycobacteroides TaxID=2618759 RepID=UPI0012DC583F|nr:MULTISPECIES: cytochrome P450 [unclassified Mycobacteroides]MUM19223.1 steroid C27-monooxygenase [Mycobacteroides sp. CBMA 326]MUM21637.1 cytochrome P450 [Mycobacteroides sp. CBMA 271]
MTCPFGAGFDFTDPQLIRQRIPHEEFALLRRTTPVWWNAQPRGASGYDDEGYWAITKHADIREVSLHDEIFSSHANTAEIRSATAHNPDVHELSRKNVMLYLDAPQHTKLRRIVARGFTPRIINGLKDELTKQAEAVVHAAADKDSGDFVHDIAAELPLLTICELIGVPIEDREQVFAWSNRLLAGGNRDDAAIADSMAASAEVLGYAYQMAEDRTRHPRDDIATALVNATVDGEALTPLEFGYYVMMLMVAGNETTRNATTHGMQAFFDHPEQWELFVRQRPASAADEVVRWSTPITCFQRTAVQDTQIGGVTIARGERVGMFYSSGNYDEEVFAEPFTFDILRDPNPHLGFGGHGAHYCIGANLARLEIDLIFNAIADIAPRIAPTGAPARAALPWVNGIESLPVRYG